ncbi:cytochrome c-type biogenesis CcmF C-terminal domain-containing protein [Bacteroidota bacterium]
MIGNILLTLALIASMFTILMYYFTLRGFNNTLKLARIGYHSMTFMVIAASALLLSAILTHQYQYSYVFNYSNDDLPIGLLMSTFYAGQEGSFMIWLLFTAIVGLILLDYTSKRDDLEYRVMIIFTLATSFLLIMVSPGLKSPFTYIWSDPAFIEVSKINSTHLNLPFLQNFLFSDQGTNKTFIKVSGELVALLSNNGISINEFIVNGKGLNPLLQNFWMQIHPPILFMGFAMSTVPFSFAFSALLKNDYKDWVKQSFPWVLAGNVVLGLAIMLGGYWAYGVLGWGGYWGWDPVENSSLVPWIIGVASIHTLLIQKKSQDAGGAGRFVKTNLILCIMIYVLVLYSTFLTRSGILQDASVHSFVKPGMTVFLILVSFISTFFLLGIGAIVYRWKYLEKSFQSEDNILSRELALFTGSVTLIGSALIILVGTSAPIFGRSVEINFYNELNLPIGIIIGLLNGLSLLLKWRQSDGKELIRKSRISILITILLSILVITIGQVYDLMLALLTFSSIFTIVVNLEILIKFVKKKIINMGGYIAHAGIAIFLLGVIATGGFSKEKQIDLEKDESYEFFGHYITFKGINLIDNGKKYAFDIEITEGDDSSIVSPVMYISEFNNSLMREPDILNRLTSDFYISPISYTDENSHQHGANGNIITIQKGNSLVINKDLTINFDKFNFPPESITAMQMGEEFYIGALLTIIYKGESFTAEPKMLSKNGSKIFEPVKIEEANLQLELTNLDASGIIELSLTDLDKSDNIQQVQETPKEILSIEASIKPFINLVWGGVIIMVVGFMISVIRRASESKN